jgi:hypothetical protein
MIRFPNFGPALLGSARLKGPGLELRDLAVRTPSGGLSQGTPYPSQGEKAALVPVLSAGLLLGGAAAFVGIRTALASRGWLRAAGWVSGAGGAAIGLFNLLALGMLLVKGKASDSRTAEL